MVDLTTIHHLKINRNLDIGTVIFVVEGEKDEFNLLKQIFTKIFDYEVAVPRTKNPDFMEMRAGAHNRAIVIRSDNSAINTLNKFEGYRDKIYGDLFTKHSINPTNAPVFYIWDRDKQNNTANMTETLIRKMYSPYDNGYYESGLLLLSYPCLESYIISCYEEKEYFDKKELPKTYIKKQNFIIGDIDEDRLVCAAGTMMENLQRFGINEFNLDDFATTNLEIFTKEEAIFKECGVYKLMSLVSIALMYLDLIVVE